MPSNLIEKEAIGLCIALEAVGNMINHDLLEIKEASMSSGEAEVNFHTHIHQELFIVRLLDFVKEKGDNNLIGVSGSCLKVLQSACDTCSFNQDNSIELLKKSVQILNEWLSYKISIKLWLPTLDIDANVEVPRLKFIEVSGNICKHNLSRLTGISNQLFSILESKGYSVQLEQIPLALDNFRKNLNENYFVYYGTWLTEMLNNIIWGIHRYLQPIYNASLIKDDSNDIRYHYKYPNEITQKIPKQWFWRLMNNVRNKPYLRKFVGSHLLKGPSSLEKC